MTILLPNERPISLNAYYAGVHWSVRKREADRVHKLVAYTAYGQPKIIKPVSIVITVFFKNRPLDPDNIFSKLYLDGLRGILIDDSPKFVTAVTTQSRVDRDNPRMEIEII